MSISVRELLKIGGFAQCKIVAGASGLDKNIVYSGSMETPDIKPWLIQEQILITTGFSIKGNPDRITSLIQDLYDMKSTALAIKTKFTGPIPHEACVLADKLSIPIIEIPPSINFVDLIPVITRAIFAGETKLLEFSQNINNQFMELDRISGGAQNIANMVTNLLFSSVQITNLNFSVICSSKNDNIEPHQVFPLFLRECRARLDEFANSTQTRFFWHISSVDLNYTVKKIPLKDQTMGYILICSKGFPNQLSNIVIDHAAAVMAIEFSKLQNQREQHRIVANNLYSDILSSNIKSEDDAMRRASNSSWPVPPFSLVSFDVNGFENLAQSMDEDKLQDTKNHIYNLITLQLFPNVQNPSIILKSDSFTCLISNSYQKKLLSLAVENILASLKKELNITLTAGIVTGINSYTEIIVADSQVRDAIKICRLDNYPKGYAFANTLKIEQAFLHLGNNNYIKSYLENTLEKLIEYDKENETELLHTLRVFTQCMGVRLQTADLLFIHRNTLMYRIKRIENIINCDLSNPNDIWALGLAFRAMQYGGEFYEYNTHTTIEN